MTKTKEFLQRFFQPGDQVCVTYKNGQECCGTVDCFLEQSVILRRADGASQFIDYDLIGTFEKSAERQLHYRLQSCLEQKKSVVLTTKNGAQISGVPTDLDEKVICIRAANGTETMITLDYVGMFMVGTAATATAPVQQTPVIVPRLAEASPAVTLDSATSAEPVSAFAPPALPELSPAERLKEFAAPLDEAKLPLNVLQMKLREDGTLASECNAKLNSLQNAIKINEFEAKYQRTPRILAELIQVTDTYYANAALLSIIAEVALMAGSVEERRLALQCLTDHWDRSCADDRNLMRLLAVLSEKQGNAAALTEITQKFSQGAEEKYLRAMAHYANAMNVIVTEETLCDNDTAASCQQLWELLTNSSFADVEEASAKEKTDARDGSAKTPQEATADGLPPLELGQRCGKITLYIPSTGFGVITDTEGKTYSFVTHNMSLDEITHVRNDAVVYFYHGGQRYNRKKQQYVDIAERICVMCDADAADLPRPDIDALFKTENNNSEQLADKEIGYVMLYRIPHGNGYICHEMNYGTAERGDIFFELTDMNPEMSLDTYHYHYKVAFNYVNGSPRRATNVVVLERLPKPDVNRNEPILQPLSVEEYCYLRFCQGETMLVERQEENAVLGRFASYADAVLTLDVGNEQIAIPAAEIKEMFFAGVVSHYQPAALSGKVNGQYPFRIHNVIGQELDSTLKQGFAASMPCLYSLRRYNDELRVHKLRAFDAALLEQLPWHSGTVSGSYRLGYYFTVDDKVRCHTSTYADTVVKGWMENQDFQRQEVLYRCVYHKSAEVGVNNIAAVQVMAKYQLADVVSPLGADAPCLQCGTVHYEAPNKLSADMVGQQLRVTFALNAQGVPAIVEADADNLQLPSYAVAIAQEKQNLEEQLRAAEATGNAAEVAEVSIKMLQEAVLPADKAMEHIFLAALRSREDAIFIEAMQSYEHTLTPIGRTGYWMQLHCLQGNMDDARKLAAEYLTLNSQEPNTVQLALELTRSDMTAEELRTKVLGNRNFTEDCFAGKIALFNHATRQGNIQWTKGKLNFSYKDMLNMNAEELNLQQYEYCVAFRIDESHHVPKAAEVKLLYRKEKTSE